MLLGAAVKPLTFAAVLAWTWSRGCRGTAAQARFGAVNTKKIDGASSPIDSAWSMKPDRQVSMPGRWPRLRPSSACVPSADSTIMIACGVFEGVETLRIYIKVDRAPAARACYRRLHHHDRLQRF
jgi:hypothetical protein